MNRSIFDLLYGSENLTTSSLLFTPLLLLPSGLQISQITYAAGKLSSFRRSSKFSRSEGRAQLWDLRMEDVALREAKPSTSFSEARLICRVCEKQFSRYTCPRCNTRYCSLECYKGHSLRCTESFMRENVMEELQQMKSNDESKRKMLEILKRVHSDEEMDSDGEEDSMLSEETIQKILSGHELRWEDLSADEIKKFKRAIASGELSKVIKPWNPWWSKPSARSISLGSGGNQRISLLRSEENMENSSGEVPAGPESPLPQLQQLIHTDPSPLLSLHLIDVIYSYCFTLRLYNGDWPSDPFGAAMVLLSVSSVFGNDGRPETVTEALSSCLEQTCSPAFRHAGGFKFGLILIDDTILLLSLGRNAIICLLSDLHRLIQAGERAVESEEMGNKKKTAESRRKLKAVERKIYFLMCWVHEQPGEAWSSMAALLEVEKASLSGINGLAKGGLAAKSKVLVEEKPNRNWSSRCPNSLPELQSWEGPTEMGDPGGGLDDKLAYFQAITGVEDLDLCTEILSAHNWDLELAISSFTSTADPTSRASAPSSLSPAAAGASAVSAGDVASSSSVDLAQQASPGLAWKIITLPFYVVSGGIGLISGAVGLGTWVAGSILSRSLGLLGLTRPGGQQESERLVPLSASAAEAAGFVAAFERDFGGSAASPPNFVGEGFMDALQRSQREFRLLFVYLHSPDHPDVPVFCSECLCSDMVAAFVNENFVCWGGSIRGSEGFKMSNSLKASRFPFCAVVMASTNQRIVLLEQIEGSKSPEEMLSILQRVVEECTAPLIAARIEAEERRHNMRLREEQDAAYRAALEADQARERQRKEEQERLAREAAEAERKRREEEEAHERAKHEAAEREAAIIRRRQEKAMSLGDEPAKGPDVTQVLVRFPTGERRERRFPSSAAVQTLYDYVDSLECLKAEDYSLVSNFPRTSYGPEKLSLSLKEAGLHPQASLFVEMGS
ncbi:hypothetical protein AXF42_Ash012661 [Apostasia shenzhenica]|uniref:UBX domain-containing protein n=1 Tax=Apostasia shenzhenica TaxID=1088818 RepID=A0A2H9ZTC3_9ASPA|nr:hypothetical protein AXF42_Ash012661 [Apostasia shenzhenica]